MNDKKYKSYDILDKINSVASSTECTGLIQIPPQNIGESEAYNEIYNIPLQVNNLKKENSENGKVIIEKEKVKI